MGGAGGDDDAEELLSNVPPALTVGKPPGVVNGAAGALPSEEFSPKRGNSRWGDMPADKPALPPRPARAGNGDTSETAEGAAEAIDDMLRLPALTWDLCLLDAGLMLDMPETKLQLFGQLLLPGLLGGISKVEDASYPVGSSNAQPRPARFKREGRTCSDAGPHEPPRTQARQSAKLPWWTAGFPLTETAVAFTCTWIFPARSTVKVMEWLLLPKPKGTGLDKMGDT
mmetsp:Transcript_86680/g.250319  ORF Transcript_86680/g.250319 Transcript_86680/m.250319 type:complete len:227 (+) Transcript_86680:181-861(+)